MIMNKTKYIFFSLVLFMLPFFSGCLFESVQQPSSAQPGEIIDVSLVITDNLVPEPNAHKGILGILVPSDWEFVSANYLSPIGIGDLFVSPEWKDSVDLYYPVNQYGPDMKWIVLISDKGYTYNNVTSFQVQLKLKVGQTQGCFNLGYLTTKATSGMINSGNSSWVPLSYPHPIGVPDSNLCKSPYETSKADEWTNLLDTNHGWTGSDGIYSIPLNEYDAPSDNPAGKQLIVFSDTFIGDVDSTGKRLNTKMVNNTLALLQSNKPDSIEFFWRKNANNTPASVFVPETPNANPGDWYWLMDGIALDDSVYVFGLRLNSTSGGLGFEVNGVTLLKFNMDEEEFIKNVKQFDTPLFYKDTTANWDIVIGQAVMPMTNVSGNPGADGFIYVYGPKSGSSDKQLVAARVLPENIEDFGKWQFWNGISWGSEIKDCASLTKGISQEFSVTPLNNGKYLLVFQTGNSVALQEGESALGPFGVTQIIYNCPEVLLDPDIFVYNAKAHPNLSDTNKLLISYNVNSYSFTDHFVNADIYRPRFIYLTTNDTTTNVIEEKETVPGNYCLNQNYPNPFNPSTKISFSIPEESNVSIKLYNALGEMITEIINKNFKPGNHEIDFSDANLSSGIYFYKMEAGKFKQTKKMILIK
ncbi:MAG: T9SS C-terminal target domain-containing protein [Ignavibacteriales bacterium]|nr:MAG: T9SS C-terminal target domain-containing protein [Ignavibacteriales bacterium]